MKALTTLDGSGAIQPLLSESWSTSADGLTWTFKLKERSNVSGRLTD